MNNDEYDKKPEHSNIISIIAYFIGLAAFLVALVLPQGMTLVANILYIIATLTAGYHIIAEGVSDTVKDSIRTKKFAPNIHLLMALAAFGACIIGQFEESALLILIFAGAHFLEEYTEGKSKREITRLLKMNPTEARLITSDGKIKTVPVESLNIGDKLQVLNGGQVPTDGQIIEGETFIDESSINGESIPKEKQAGDSVFGSTINGSGVFVMEVTKDSSETVFAKVLKLVSQSQNDLSKTATKIKRIEPIYVTIVMALAPLVVLIGGTLLGWSWSDSLYKGIVFLISASPCALAASAVPATLSGISNLAKKGVLIKGGSFLTNLTEIRSIAFDKTGTLTVGKPQVTEDYFIDIDDNDKKDILSIIVSMEGKSNHPLATAIISKYEKTTKPVDLEVTNIVGQGIMGEYNGSIYQIAKPTVFSDIDDRLAKKSTELSEAGQTVVYISKDKKVIGLIGLMDIPNKNAKSVIDYFKSQKVHTAMITGDSEATGRAVAKGIGIDQVIANVLPEEKLDIIKDQQEKYGLTGMVGDGVNDAPALVKADIGVAMGEGTDVAIDVADMVLMNNNLNNLVYAHKVSKRLNRVVFQNIIFSMFIVALLISLNFMGKMDISIGVITHEGSTLLVILNGLRLLKDTK